MEQDLFIGKRKKCYIVYEVDVEATISMIVNPNSEFEYRTESKVVHALNELGPSCFVYAMEMPDENFLSHKIQLYSK